MKSAASPVWRAKGSLVLLKYTGPKAP
jgi:hypothetical protein